MEFSWVFILFVATLTAAAIFGLWSLARTRKAYSAGSDADLAQASELKRKAEEELPKRSERHGA